MRKLFIILVLTVLFVGLFTSPSEAKPDGPWVYQDTTQGFYGSDDITLEDLFNNSDLSMPVFYKWTHNMRLIKAKANTRAEYVHLKKFYVSQDSKSHPIIFCSKSKTKAYFIDLAFYYDERYAYLTNAEKTKYKSWAKGYAKRHPGCIMHRKSNKEFQIYGEW